MATLSMKEAFAKAGVELTKEEWREEVADRQAKHRTKTVLERPSQEVKLSNLTEEDFERKKYQADPTDDLVVVKPALTEVEFKRFGMGTRNSAEYNGFLVWCKNTQEVWYAPTELCLNQNFIYRGDLEIVAPKTESEAWNFYKDRGAKVDLGVVTRKKCYILDNPAGETYEVYYDSEYPSVKYGKATPNGMFVHKYRDRFHRDMRILELDKMYSEESGKKAGEFVSQSLGGDEAIIVSDGSFMRGTCACAHYYLDNVTLIKMTQGIIPTEPDQAVLIAEIQGATNALGMCRAKGKKKVTYYYDNTSILNVFRNRKTEYITEVVAYKKLLEEMDAEGFDVMFVELHPKTGDARVDANKALMFFHNYCDKECQEIVSIFTKDYRKIAGSDYSVGKTFKQVKQEFKPKGRPGQSSGQGPKNNQHTGNNRYGKRF